jgi:subtilisin family serine protease
VRALDVLARRDVSVINMSFAGPENALLSAALDAVGRQDIALVAAAGNAGPRAAPLYPAANPTVVAVTAVGSSLDVYRQANSGAYIRFAAPGVQVWTAASISGGRFRSGTSYAAPFVTAAIAAARHADPQASIDDVLGDLARSATDLGPEGRDDTFGWGLVQALGSCA